MSVAIKQYDVMVVHVASDKDVADDLASQLIQSGFSAKALLDEPGPGENFEDRLRETISGADAMVLVVSPASVNSSWMLAELGAAMVWDTPIFVVRWGMSGADLPDFLRRYVVQPASSVNELIRAIERSRSTADWDEDARHELLSLYSRQGVTADGLATEFRELDALTRQFNQRTGRKVRSQDLIRQLFRLRKLGDLPPLKTRRRA